jgi:SanA protein
MSQLLKAIWRRKLVLAALLLVLVPAATVSTNAWVLSSSDKFVFKSVNELPGNDVGLLLGVSHLLGRGFVNPHFARRTEAAAYLYHAGKVRHLLVSGDNHVEGYDEPTDMKEALVRMGVPESAITLDYAGFRTLDSVIRARDVFGRRQLTIITDEFHAYRSVFLARQCGIDAVAFCSVDVPQRFSREARFREYGARVKAVMDLFLLNTHPRYLGEPVEIMPTDSSR